MSFIFIKDFIYDAALLLSLSVIYETTYHVRYKHKGVAPFHNGLYIGIIGMCIMSIPLRLTPGVIFDARSILLGVAALTFGPLPALIAAGMTLIYRIILGGFGLWSDIAIILSSTAIGLVWRRYVKPEGTAWRWLSVYLMGVVIHGVMLLCMLLMPRSMIGEVLASISLPVMLVFPLVTVLLGMLLISQKRRNEAMTHITEAEERYRSLFDHSRAVMFLVGPDGRILDANQAASDFYGWSVQTMKTMTVFDINILPEEDVRSVIEKSLSEKKNHYLFRHRKAGGGTAAVEVHTSPITFNGATVLYSIVHDITQRVAAHQALEESEKRFRLLVESAPEAIFIQTGGILTFVNRFMVSLCGAQSAEQMTGHPVMEFIHPDYHETASEQMGRLISGEKRMHSGEGAFVRLDGSTVDVDITAVPIRYKHADGTLVFARDISQRKKMEAIQDQMKAQLIQQQKLEAIGTLAGGVAHEINNPINGIMNYAQLVLDALDPADESAEYTREIIHETERISTIVKNLLQFSRQEKQAHSFACVRDMVEQTMSLIRTVIRKDQINLEMDLPGDLPDIKCRSQQIQQVLMNLMTNARDALNERYPGYHDNKIIRLWGRHFEKNGRPWVRLTVEDHGNGIPAGVQERIFEPFFSTKPKDKGTGLGLSISFGIIRDHHGLLSIESKSGQYTRMHLDLPVDNGWVLEEHPAIAEGSQS